MMTQLLPNVSSLTAQCDPVLVWDGIVHRAVEQGASDIHLAAEAQGHRLDLRLDGRLEPQGTIPLELAKRVINHVKSASGIDMSDHRRPTEGRMKIHFGDRMIDLRVSVIPTIHGQDMVVRILDGTISLRDLHDLGMLDEQLLSVRDMISRPHGLILVSGSAGSGKTTTLYAMLRQLVGKGRKIMTIEDPVEYEMAGVNQTQVNARIGVGFAGLLAAILRQNPDVIMVGEIRDHETAATAVRAANTGNLVLATTHATKASRAIETILSLDVNSYFFSVALRGVIAQTLVRRVCAHCSTPLPETAEMIIEDSVRRRLADCTMPQMYQGQGCAHCHGSGYSGRKGLFELFTPDDHLKRMILERRAAEDIDSTAIAGGMLTLQQSGMIAALRGQTTMEELVDKLPMM